MTNVTNRIYLYGLDDNYFVVRYAYTNRDEWLGIISELKTQAFRLVESYPRITGIWAIDNSYDVYEACRESMRTGTMEDRIVFKILLDTNGVRIL